MGRFRASTMQVFFAILATVAATAVGRYWWTHGSDSASFWKAWRWMTEPGTWWIFEDAKHEPSGVEGSEGKTEQEKVESLPLVSPFQQEEVSNHADASIDFQEEEVTVEEEEDRAWLGTVSFKDISGEEEPEEDETKEEPSVPKLAVRLGRIKKTSPMPNVQSVGYAPPLRVIQARAAPSVVRPLVPPEKALMTAPPIREQEEASTSPPRPPVTSTEVTSEKLVALPKLPPRPVSKIATEKEKDEKVHKSRGKKVKESRTSLKPKASRKPAARKETERRKKTKKAGAGGSQKARNGILLGVGAAALSIVGGVAAVFFGVKGRDSKVQKMTVRKVILSEGNEKRTKGKKTIDQMLEESGLI